MSIVGSIDLGLYSESSILIDGKPVAGKSNEVDSRLARISAGEVNHLGKHYAYGIRYHFNSNILNNDVREIEQNCFTSGRGFAFKVRGTL